MKRHKATTLTTPTQLYFETEGWPYEAEPCCEEINEDKVAGSKEQSRDWRTLTKVSEEYGISNNVINYCSRMLKYNIRLLELCIFRGIACNI